MNDNPRATAELWKQLKTQFTTTNTKQWLVKTATQSKIKWLDFYNSQSYRDIIKMLIILLFVAVSLKLFATFSVLLPAIGTIILYKKRNLFASKIKNQELVDFLVKFNLIDPKPELEPIITYKQCEKISGKMFWQYKNYTGNYQIVGGEIYKTAMAIVICDQGAFPLKQCLAHKIGETIKKNIK